MQFYESDRYQPSIEDVLAVKDVFLSLLPDSPLPLELIDAIVDLAEYWPHTSTTLSQDRQETYVRAGGDDENRFMLRSFPIGFPDYKNDAEGEYQIVPKDQASYPSVAPKPWPKEREVPQDATAEVINKWTHVSRPKGEHPCRKIVFKIKSRDQGWGGLPENKGTYKGSSTWFDAGIERMSATREAAHLLEAWEVAPWPQFRLSKSDTDPMDWGTEIACSLRTIDPDYESNPNSDPEKPLVFKHELDPSSKHIQRNRTAWKNSELYEITWKYTDDIKDPESLEATELDEKGRGRETMNGEFVRNLKVGDVVTVWAKARYGGWCNIVEDIKIDVYWAL
ncbi:ankyrin repeat protein [Rutstroemia sp. NJR-2017a WRK4]|nr:ankyrin repeat protein [Rutstroemia sp. NJR-2017a WRK4]